MAPTALLFPILLHDEEITQCVEGCAFLSWIPQLTANLNHWRMFWSLRQLLCVSDGRSHPTSGISTAGLTEWRPILSTHEFCSPRPSGHSRVCDCLHPATMVLNSCTNHLEASLWTLKQHRKWGEGAVGCGLCCEGTRVCQRLDKFLLVLGFILK